MRSAWMALGLMIYAVGAVAAIVLIVVVARADTSIVRSEGAVAPALELGPGVYDLAVPEGSPSPEVFALASRVPRPLRSEGAATSFEVEAPGIYVVDLPLGGALSSRERFVASPTLFFMLVVAPLATLPGIGLVDLARPASRRDVLLGGSPFRLASVRHRLSCLVLDFIAIAAMLILLVLLTPLLTPIAPFVPLAPVAYVWAGNARGQTIGRWLGGTRVVTDEGTAPGWMVGGLRSLVWLVGWSLLGGGYLVAALNTSRKAPHDLVARSSVVCD